MQIDELTLSHDNKGAYKNKKYTFYFLNKIYEKIAGKSNATIF